jgi:peptidyl-prolyl cis-trans isomerase A (cyclophilin A)
VVEGQDVVDAIAQGDLLKVEIVRVGEEAEKWNAIEAFITFKERNKRDSFKSRCCSNGISSWV